MVWLPISVKPPQACVPLVCSSTSQTLGTACVAALLTSCFTSTACYNLWKERRREGEEELAVLYLATEHDHQMTYGWLGCIWKSQLEQFFPRWKNTSLLSSLLVQRWCVRHVREGVGARTLLASLCAGDPTSSNFNGPGKVK